MLCVGAPKPLFQSHLALAVACVIAASTLGAAQGNLYQPVPASCSWAGWRVLKTVSSYMHRDQLGQLIVDNWSHYAKNYLDNMENCSAHRLETTSKETGPEYFQQWHQQSIHIAIGVQKYTLLVSNTNSKLTMTYSRFLDACFISCRTSQAIIYGSHVF
ncbi:hypothetical protein BKA67DRAFT_94913 [Truncatella angustata]|uniref:Uncharacterized protein n=1 Tax=Truncatella angustata TaxID=152316 RepID=A0A9P8UBI8_9PEZI|nr:uncharacterized protein BKA67DRAFT_94913 [Truncatella angustata]KAH6646127.1 hypothetical protein BKA67DRAFT_94913 [Truncatella angustata]